MSSHQEKVNRAAYAKELQENPLLKEAFLALKTATLEKFSKTRKGDGYEDELKRVHEDMQALMRLEAYIDKTMHDVTASKAAQQIGKTIA